MAFVFEEIDYQETPLGAISLRKRSEPRLDDLLIYEVKLGEEFLMSSLFTEAEVQLSRMGLADLTGELDVVVGGLGLGYTALAALEFPNVRSLKVVDVMEPVIRWHKEGLVPVGQQLMADKRCQLIHADFFKVSTDASLGFDGSDQPEKVHAILLDIDHSPSYWLNPGNGDFYTEQALHDMAAKIHSGGVFALWSDELPDEAFIALLNRVFSSTQAHVVPFANPYTGGESTNSVYVCHKAK